MGTVQSVFADCSPITSATEARKGSIAEVRGQIAEVESRFFAKDVHHGGHGEIRLRKSLLSQCLPVLRQFDCGSQKSDCRSENQDCRGQRSDCGGRKPVLPLRPARRNSENEVGHEAELSGFGTAELVVPARRGSLSRLQSQLIARRLRQNLPTDIDRGRPWIVT